jgi:hypothetical protein
MKTRNPGDIKYQPKCNFPKKSFADITCAVMARALTKVWATLMSPHICRRKEINDSKKFSTLPEAAFFQHNSSRMFKCAKKPRHWDGVKHLYQWQFTGDCFMYATG